MSSPEKLRHEANKLFRKTANKLYPQAGCGDGGCIFGHPGGQHTNGGCRCLGWNDASEARIVARQLALIGRELAKELLLAQEAKAVEPVEATRTVSTTTVTIDNDDPEWPV